MNMDMSSSPPTDRHDVTKVRRTGRPDASSQLIFIGTTLIFITIWIHDIHWDAECEMTIAAAENDDWSMTAGGWPSYRVAPKYGTFHFRSTGCDRKKTSRVRIF